MLRSSISFTSRSTVTSAAVITAVVDQTAACADVATDVLDALHVPVEAIVDAIGDLGIREVDVDLDGGDLTTTFTVDRTFGSSDVTTVIGPDIDLVAAFFDRRLEIRGSTLIAVANVSGTSTFGRRVPVDRNVVPPPNLRCDHNTFVVRLPADDRASWFARAVLRRVVIAPDEQLTSLLLAVSEIVANAIDEHRRHHVEQPVELHVCSGATPRATVVDHGRGLLPSGPDDLGDARPTDGWAPESGRGLVIAHGLVPGIEIEADDTGSRVSVPLCGGVLA